MKKTALVCINAKYIHSALGIYSINAYAKAQGISVDALEYSINHNEDVIARDIYEKKYDVVAFSCYIFNIDYVKKAAMILKKANPNLVVWLGGPEVSFAPKEYLAYPFVDGIMMGEGEETFCDLYRHDFCGKDVLGCAYKKGDELIENPWRPTIENLDDIPFAYTDENMDTLKDRLIYYETSRGCPFRCSYCLSSTDHSVRYYSLARVKENLDFFARHHVPLVKFVDRTFNADRGRAVEIMRYMASLPGETTFHFEVSADLLTDEMMEIVENAREGLFQFEVGIQSTNKDTLCAINRADHFAQIKAGVTRLVKSGKCHVHVDLIAGLPYEDMASFRRSFNDVYRLHAQDLQLGFLKLLYGTQIRREADKFHYAFWDDTPYEVIANDFISFDDIVKLKKVEDVLERFYNAGGFESSLRYLEGKYVDAYAIYEDLAAYFDERNQTMQPCSKAHLYGILADFYADRFGEANEFLIYLTYDYYRTQKVGNMPDWCPIRMTDEFRKWCLAFVFDEENVAKYLPEYAAEPPKKILKHVHFLPLPFDVGVCEKNEPVVYLFENSKRKAIKIG